MVFAALIVKSTLILLAGLAGSWMLRRRSASARHLLLSVCMAAALALPLAAMVLPSFRVDLPILPANAGEPAPVAATPRALDDPSVSAVPAVESAATADANPVTPAAGAPILMRLSAIGWFDLLVVLWLAGAVLVLSRIALALVAARRFRRRAQPIADPELIAESRRAAADLGLTAPVPVLSSPRVPVPMSCGILDPVLLLPPEAEGWSADRRRVVLLHELAHVRRRDCLTQTVAHLACAMHWMNPLAWVLATRQLAERERACDDLVLAAGTEAADYAGHLLEIARGFKVARVPAWGTVTMARPSQLEGRLLAILDPSKPRLGFGAAGSALVGVLAAVAFVPLAALELRPAPAGSTTLSVGVTNDGDLPALVEAAPGDETKRDPLAPESARTALPAADALPGIAAVPESPALPPQEAAAGQIAEAAEPADRRLVDALVTALEDKDKEVREQAAHALGRLRTPRAVAGLTVALGDSEATVRREAVSGLVGLGLPGSAGPLLLALKDADPEVREVATSGLAQLRDSRHVDAFATMLSDPHGPVREQAAHALGQMRASSAIGPLIEALKDTDPDVRQQAAHALGQLRATQAVDGLIAALADSDADVRQQAAYALSQTRDPRAADALTRALADRDADVRQQAAHALGELRARAAVQGLIAALSDPDVDVREQVAHALGEIRDPAAVEPLTRALRDENPNVRRGAAAALGHLADHLPDGDEIDEDEDEKEEDDEDDEPEPAGVPQ